jgi:hypothetical protein
LALPHIITVTPEMHKALFDQTDMKQAMVDFAHTFAQAGADLPRADAPLTDACTTVVEKFMTDLCPDTVLFASAVAKIDPNSAEIMALASAMQVTSYGVIKGHITTATEKNQMPCFRIGHKGTRTLAFTKFLKLVDFISQSDVANPLDVAKAVDTRARCRQFVKNLRKEGLEGYKADGGIMLAGTVGPTDLLYLPAGWIFTEKNSATVAACGVRVPCLAKFAAASEFMTEMKTRLETSKADATAYTTYLAVAAK